MRTEANGKRAHTPQSFEEVPFAMEYLRHVQLHRRDKMFFSKQYLTYVTCLSYTDSSQMAHVPRLFTLLPASQKAGAVAGTCPNISTGRRSETCVPLMFATFSINRNHEKLATVWKSTGFLPLSFPLYKHGGNEESAHRLLHAHVSLGWGQ